MPERVTIEVDLGQLSVDWEVVRVGPVKADEPFISRTTSRVVIALASAPGPYIVVRPRWQWSIICAMESQA